MPGKEYLGAQVAGRPCLLDFYVRSADERSGDVGE